MNSVYVAVSHVDPDGSQGKAEPPAPAEDDQGGAQAAAQRQLPAGGRVPGGRVGRQRQGGLGAGGRAARVVWGEERVRDQVTRGDYEREGEGLVTRGDDEREAGDGGGLGDLAADRGAGLLWRIQLVGYASGRSSPIGRPRSSAVATETDPT